MNRRGRTVRSAAHFQQGNSDCSQSRGLPMATLTTGAVIVQPIPAGGLHTFRRDERIGEAP